MFVVSFYRHAYNWIVKSALRWRSTYIRSRLQLQQSDARFLFSGAKTWAIHISLQFSFLVQSHQKCCMATMTLDRNYWVRIGMQQNHFNKLKVAYDCMNCIYLFDSELILKRRSRAPQIGGLICAQRRLYFILCFGKFHLINTFWNLARLFCYALCNSINDFQSEPLSCCAWWKQNSA